MQCTCLNLNDVDEYEASIDPLCPIHGGKQLTCKHCGRLIVQEHGRWVDPQASGDDSVWRETCDAHDTMTAEHEPEQSEGPHGHCDTCGAACDENGCTRDRRHLAALTEQQTRCRLCEHPYVEVLDSPGVLVHLNQDGADHDQDADHTPVPAE